MFGRRNQIKILEAERNMMYRHLKKIAELPSCFDCAKKRTHTCPCPPGGDYPYRINCPHYTKAEVRT